MEWLAALLALTAMEVVLGIDNLVFISIASSRLPTEQQPLARRLGLIGALVTRLLLLVSLFWFVNGEQFQQPVFKLSDINIPDSVIEKISFQQDPATSHLPEEVIEQVNHEHFLQANEVSIKDLILFLGGLFLVGKSVYDIHEEFGHSGAEVKASSSLFMGVLVQIMIFDVVFSLDSVITAVGLVKEIWVMVTSIVITVIVMLVFAEPVSHFVERHPTLKMLALSFMILIGVMLIAEGVGAHIDKGYVYFAMFFALFVEVLNISIRSRDEPDEPLGVE